ncbi:MAG: hypothetical protein QM802_23395 [Agriterribacter sp.]
MRFVILIVAFVLFSVACNNASKDTNTKTTDDSLPTQGNVPKPPDIGSSPAAADSAAKQHDSTSDKPTPGLGSDPTRNDASKKPKNEQ